MRGGERPRPVSVLVGVSWLEEGAVRLKRVRTVRASAVCFTLVHVRFLVQIGYEWSSHRRKVLKARRTDQDGEASLDGTCAKHSPSIDNVIKKGRKEEVEGKGRGVAGLGSINLHGSELKTNGNRSVIVNRVGVLLEYDVHTKRYAAQWGNKNQDIH